VTDNAHLLSTQTRDQLDTLLEGYEQSSGHQVVVWIGDSIGDEDLADWSAKTFAAWKLGRAKLDDGVAVFLLAKDRKIDIEVGYGLEGQLTDAITSRIIHEQMEPQLKAGNADGAVTSAVVSILKTLNGGNDVNISVTSHTTTHGNERGLPPILLLILGAVFVVLLITHPRMALWLMWSIMSGGRFGGGGGGGGGGDGGFRGGGGRSGGGGARGSW
jgi:uncharacterized protein